MKLLLLSTIVLLPLLIASHNLQHQNPTTIKARPIHSASSFSTNSTSPTVHAAAAPTPALTPWQKYVCRGQKLTKACQSTEFQAPQFGTPLSTRFDSTLEVELKRWGYVERNDEVDAQYCQLLPIMMLEPLEELGVKGENRCFWFQHYRRRDQDGGVAVEKQTYEVDGKTYRNTYGKAIIGANAQTGALFFIDRVSAFSGAKRAWAVDNPPPDQLPELRQMSDLAWGIWRRVHPDGKNLGDIKYFFVNQIVNIETQGLIAEALGKYTPPPGQARVSEVPEWPGLIWGIETQEGAAMLGSPNGIAVGYFLAQHKSQLDGDKYVSKVQVYVDTEDGDPYMVFHVSETPMVPQH